MSSPIASTPKPPYYAVIFTSLRTPNDNGYGETAAHMIELANQQEGFLGVESARNTSESPAVGITVSYWKDLTSIRIWKEQLDHWEAQRKGRSEWYENYTVRIAQVERDYDLSSSDMRDDSL